MNESLATVAYVTGASRGIGRLIATAIAETGAPTVGFARSSDELDSLVEATRVVPVAMDVAIRCRCRRRSHTPSRRLDHRRCS